MNILIGMIIGYVLHDPIAARISESETGDKHVQ